MAINYSCDICAKKIDRHLDAVIISGGKKLTVICENCWTRVENLVLSQEEAISADER